MEPGPFQQEEKRQKSQVATSKILQKCRKTNTTKNFIVRVGKYWNGLSKEVKESSSPEILSIQQDKHLSKAYICILEIAIHPCKPARKDIVEFYLGFVDTKQEGRGTEANQVGPKKHNGCDKVHRRMGLKPQTGSFSMCELRVKRDSFEEEHS